MVVYVLAYMHHTARGGGIHEEGKLTREQGECKSFNADIISFLCHMATVCSSVCIVFGVDFMELIVVGQEI